MMAVDLFAILAGSRASSAPSVDPAPTTPHAAVEERGADDGKAHHAHAAVEERGADDGKAHHAHAAVEERGADDGKAHHQVGPSPGDALATLRARLRGRLVQPSDAADMFEGSHRGLIVECAGVADVIAAVNFAREDGLPIVIRGDGHNVSRDVTCHSGLAIDLSPMKSVHVDPIAQSVRAEGGVTIADLDHETRAFGLAIPAGMATATSRVAGLTFGGGLGWLRRKYAVSCANLLSADIVTADGRLVTASAEADADLLWALQAGGCNFGIVTSSEFRTYPIGPDVFFTSVVHAGADARAALRFFREWEATAPDEVSASAILGYAPDLEEIPAEHHGKPIAAALAMYCGDAADGAKVLQPLRCLGSPIADVSATMPYLDAQRFFDADHPPHAMRYYWKTCDLASLTDEAIHVLVDLNETSPSPHSTLDIWRLGRRSGRDPRQETAFGDRLAPYLIGIESNWERPEDHTRCLAWGRQAFRALERFSPNSECVNLPGLYEDSKQITRDTFDGNIGRLQALKERYDPTDLFQVDHYTVAS